VFRPPFRLSRGRAERYAAAAIRRKFLAVKGEIMGVIAITVGGLLLIVWVVRLMNRADKVNRQRVQHRQEIWEAEGGTGPHPDNYMPLSG
jgi:hypothetical protein